MKGQGEGLTGLHALGFWGGQIVPVDGQGHVVQPFRSNRERDPHTKPVLGERPQHERLAHGVAPVQGHVAEEDARRRGGGEGPALRQIPLKHARPVVRVGFRREVQRRVVRASVGLGPS